MPFTAPPEITAEVVLEMIASVCADLHQIAADALSARTKHRAVFMYHEMHDRRFSFDPHDARAVEAIVAEVATIARATRAGRLP